MSEDDVSPIQPAYILKVVSGLLILGILVFAAVNVDSITASPTLRLALVALLIILSLGIVPFVHFVYRKMDELNRHMHQAACVSTLALIAASSAACGVLQAAGFIPMFNQFWALGVIVVIWGIRLMLVDRRYK